MKKRTRGQDRAGAAGRAYHEGMSEANREAKSPLLVTTSCRGSRRSRPSRWAGDPGAGAGAGARPRGPRGQPRGELGGAGPAAGRAGRAARVRLGHRAAPAGGQEQPGAARGGGGGAARGGGGQPAPGAEPAFYEGFRQMRAGAGWAALSPAQQRIVEASIEDAELAGVSLEGAAKERFLAIETELAQAGHRLLEPRARRDQGLLPGAAHGRGGGPGCPQACGRRRRSRRAARPPSDATLAAATPEQGPWRITLEPPLYVPFMEHSRRRDPARAAVPGLRDPGLERRAGQPAPHPGDPAPAAGKGPAAGAGQLRRAEPAAQDGPLGRRGGRAAGRAAPGQPPARRAGARGAARLRPRADRRPGLRAGPVGRALLGRAPARGALRLPGRGAAALLSRCRPCWTGCSRWRGGCSAW